MKAITNVILCLSMLGVAAVSPALSQEGDSGKTEILQQMQDNNQHLYAVLIAKHLISLQMPPTWWSKMTASDHKGVEAVEYVARSISEYAEHHSWGNAADFEDSLSVDNAEEKRARMQPMIDGWKGKVSITFKAEPKTCDAASYDLAMRYLKAVGEAMESKQLQPASGIANVTLVASGTAKDISVTTADGKNFVCTAPVDHEPTDWGTKISTAFERVSKDRIK